MLCESVSNYRDIDSKLIDVVATKGGLTEKCNHSMDESNAFGFDRICKEGLEYNHQLIELLRSKI